MGHTDVRGAKAAAEAAASLRQLNERSREIFKRVVETYLETGEPVGSRNLSRGLPMTLSPASVRNVMSDLEALGLIYAPHTSAGRLPTQTGLRLFVDGLLEIGDITEAERKEIEARMATGVQRRSVNDFLAEAGQMLSGLSRCAGVVLAEKQSKTLRHVEFVNLGQGQALAVLVGEDGDVENRIVTLPEGLPPSSLNEATNYMNARISGMTLAEARTRIETEIDARRAQLDALTAQVVTDGLAERADGVRIFIGSENNLFSLSGSALIVSPFEDSEQKIVGVLGVIGPTRLNYGRIIPMVDYTARLLGRLVP